MEISLSVFLTVYLIFVVIFLVFSFFNIYHLLRFSLNFTSLFVITLYVLVVGSILALTAEYVLGVDWGQTFELIPTSGSQLF